MMKAPERRALQQTAEEALAGSETWTGWVRVTNITTPDGTCFTWVIFRQADREQDTWVTPAAIEALKVDRHERVAPRLFA